MKWAVVLLFISLAFGQLGAIPITSSVTLYPHDVVLGLLFVVEICKKKKKNNVTGTLTRPIRLFIITAVLSLLVSGASFPSVVLFQSALYLVRWVIYAGLYVVVLRSTLPSVFWLTGLYGAGVTLASLGIIQYVWYPYLRNLSYLGWDPHKYRVFTTLLDPNFAGILFVLTLLLGLYLLVEIKRKNLILVSQSVTLIALLLTYSRSSYLAFLVGIGVYVAFNKLWKAGLLMTGIFLTILFFLPKPDGEGVKLFRTVSTFARFGNWHRGFELIGEAPFLGHGFNTLRYVQQAKGWLDESAFPSKAGAGLDNSFQFIWATTGIVGFAVYMWILTEIANIGFTVARQKTDNLLGIIVIASLGSIFVHSQFSNSFLYPWVMIWLWVLVGCAQKVKADR